MSTEIRGKMQKVQDRLNTVNLEIQGIESDIQETADDHIQKGKTPDIDALNARLQGLQNEAEALPGILRKYAKELQIATEAEAKAEKARVAKARIAAKKAAHEYTAKHRKDLQEQLAAFMTNHCLAHGITAGSIGPKGMATIIGFDAIQACIAKSKIGLKEL